MNTAKKLSRLALAATAAAIFSTAAMTGTATADEGKVGKCMGANSCKGHSQCKGESNACAGKNACKGQGFVKMTKDACMAISPTSPGASAFLFQDIG